MRISISVQNCRRALSLFPFVGTLSLLTTLAGAQAPDAARRANAKPVVPSLSNLPKGKQSKGSGSDIAVVVAAEPAVADAIAADSLADLFQLIDEHWHKGEYNHAINLNQIVMEGDPKNVETYANNAWLLWSTDRADLGIATLKKGIAANPKIYYMYDELGNFYRINLKDYRSALPYFEQAAKFECPLATWHGLAQCYEKTGQWEKAVQAWSTACRDPKDAIALVHLKRAQAQLDAELKKKGGSGK